MSRNRNHFTTRLYLESLENREIPSIDLTSRAWTATGTEQSDIIIVDRKPNTTADLRMRILDRSTGAVLEQDTRHAVDVDRVELDGLGGDDILVNWTSRPSSLFGGEGWDSVIGGFGDDILDGDYYAFADSVPVVIADGGSIISVNDPNAPAFHSLGTDHIRNEGYGSYLDLSGLQAGVNLDLAQINVAQTVLANRLSLLLEADYGSVGIGVVFGTNFDDVLRGDAGENFLIGGDGNDTLEGRRGPDHLYGYSGSDTYVFTGSNLGNDMIGERVREFTAQSDGTDTLDFSQFDSAVNLDLSPTVQMQTVSANNLTLNAPTQNPENDLGLIENVFGSRFSDTIRGNAFANKIQGMNGNDILEGRGGDDELIGGHDNDSYVFSGYYLGHDTIHESSYLLVGTDTLVFSGFSSGISLDLRLATRQTIVAGNLELTLDNGAGGAASIENVFGSSFNDTIYGNDQGNWISGGVGNDTIYGLGGGDTLIGNVGTDTLYGGEDNDYLYGNVPSATSARVEGDLLYGEGGLDYQETWIYVYLYGVPNLNRLVWTN